MPGVVIEFSVDWLHDGLEGPGAQIDDEGDGPIFERQIDIVGRLPRVQEEAVALPGLEGQRDLVAAALDGVLRQVVAEVLRAAEGGYVLLPRWKRQRGKKTKCYFWPAWLILTLLIFAFVSPDNRRGFNNPGICVCYPRQSKSSKY